MKYDLTGINGNAFSVMGYVTCAMRECEFSKEDINAYHQRAMSGDYENLLCESVQMIDKCNEVAEGEYRE